MQKHINDFYIEGARLIVSWSASEKRRDTPPISIAILLHKHALICAESSIYTANLYHNTAPFVSPYFCRSIRVRGRFGTRPPPKKKIIRSYEDVNGKLNRARCWQRRGAASWLRRGLVFALVRRQMDGETNSIILICS